MPSLSEQRVPTTRRVLLSWIPTTIVALIIVAVIVGTVAMQNSWWTQTDPRPSADQQASDGMSVFGSAGVDYFAREGVVRVKVRADSLPATELGLEANEVRTIEPRVPISAVVLGDDGAFSLDLVGSFTVTSVDNKVTSIELVPTGNGMWLSVYPDLERLAPGWGWSDEQLEQLQADLTAASRGGNSVVYSANLPQVEAKGALVSARVEVDTASSEVGLSFTITGLS